MSLEATWDLSVASQPRSFCVFTPPDSDSPYGNNINNSNNNNNNAASNPFEVAAAHPSEQAAVVQAIVVGTERGTLHYRTYAPLEHTAGLPSNNSSSSKAAQQQQQQQQQNQRPNPHQLQAPLGMTSHHHHPNLPRSYYPVDFSGIAGGQPVVGLTQITPQLFLVLVDDHRGTSAAQPGAFHAQWMTLSQGRFGVWQPSSSTTTTTQQQQQQGSNSNTPLPRMSCAVYHPNCGIVYAAGRQLGQVSIPDTSSLHLNNQSHPASSSSSTTSNSRRRNNAGGGGGGINNRSSNSSGGWKKYRFCNATLPAPGARSGPDAMAMSGNGSVVVVAVGNSFVAVTGTLATNNNGNNNDNSSMMADDNSTNFNHDSNSSTTTTKLISFQQSSQVHPVLCLDVNDPSLLDQDWSCWFLASSRTCAVVDFYNAPPSRIITNAATSTQHYPRGETTVTLASPILAAATSWPWLVVLTSDGLLSVRSPSCLAIALRTVEVGTRPNDYFSLRTLVPTAANDHNTNNNNTNMMINQQQQQQDHISWIVAISYAGHAKALQCKADSAQDLADRFMRLAIDALGVNGFPRAALAEAVNASFTATSYVGPEPTAHSRYLFKHYLEAILGLMDLESGATTSWPTQPAQGGSGGGGNSGGAGGGGGRRTGEAAHHGAFGEAQSNQQHPSNLAARRSQWQDRLPPILSAASPPSLLTGAALLCLVCASMRPAHASLANRSARACVNQLGMIVAPQQVSSDGAVRVCESVAETLLQESTHQQQQGDAEFSLIEGSSPKPIVSSAKGVPMEFVEAAVWLLRSCGKHERAMQVLYERMQQQQQVQSSQQSQTVSSSTLLGGWSQIKYDSYTATHMSELWGSSQDEGCQLVLQSQATRRLLERNPRLGLSAFTALYPENPGQWKALNSKDDPLAHSTYPRQVLQLLQSIQPVVPYESSRKNKMTTISYPSFSPSDEAEVTSKSTADDDDDPSLTVLPLESGRALSVAFLESALGIATGRPSERDEFDSLPMEDGFEERMADYHDELAFLLLEGVISERGDAEPETGANTKADEDATPLGRVYRMKLRRLLRWPLCKVRPDRFLSALPASFLQERAFALGNLGRHEEALTIFYRDLKRLDLALEYCDVRHQQIQDKRDRDKARRQQQGGGFFDDLVVSEQEQNYFDSYDRKAPPSSDCAYVPLVRVALETCETPEEGTKAAIQVLALRRSVMDWGAALRLLPKDVPVSAVARPFLIPALVESESQVRRLTVVSSLLRSRYSSLKQQLTAAQLKAQENLHVVPQLQDLKLGDPLHSTKPFRARPSSSASPTFPDVMIIKHFFPRHLVIQAKVKHTLDGRSMGDVNFVVAESSEEAIQPSLQVPLKALPYNVQGSTWCVLNASPQRMDSLAILTCELRYTILDAEGTAGFTAMDSGGAGRSRSYVEELQDLEVYATHFQ